MFDSGKKTALRKKAYEIAYAFFRVTANMGERDIAEKLKDKAVLVLEMIVADDYAGAGKPLEVLDYLVKLAMDLNAIGFANGEALTKEMGNLTVMIAECVETQGEAVDISELFPKGTSDVPEDVSSRNFFSEEGIAVSRAEEYQARTRPESRSLSKSIFETGSEEDSPSVAVEVSRSEQEQSSNSSTSGFLKSGMRQIAILDKIRQSGHCRLRDIQEILPDSSERTIRYDLESLIERRLIERVGNGGPSIFYRMRQN